MATRAKAGSDAAFQELARRLTGYMRFREAGCYLVGGTRDDLHQEALYGLHKACRDYRPDRGANFETFARLCIDRQIGTAIKTALRQKYRPVSDRIALAAPDAAGDSPQAEDRQGEFLDPDSDPHDVLIARQRWETFVRLASGSLSEMEGEIFGPWLSGLSYREIAERTGYDEKAIDNALGRVRRKLTTGLELAA